MRWMPKGYGGQRTAPEHIKRDGWRETWRKPGVKGALRPRTTRRITAKITHPPNKIDAIAMNAINRRMSTTGSGIGHAMVGAGALSPSPQKIQYRSAASG